jgi:hypothetical protein
MGILNSAFDILGGFEVTQSGSSPTNKTVVVSSGVYRKRTVGSTTFTDSAYISVLGSATNSITGGTLALADSGYKRIDLVILETATPTFKVITGTQVLAAGTAVVPALTSATQIPLATIAVSDTSPISVRTDVRDTADYLPVRAFNRSQNVRIGKQVVKTNSNVYVDLNDPVSTKELSYHSAIGAVYTTGSITSTQGDLQINTGTKVTATWSSPNLTVAVGSGEIRNADNQTLYTVAGGNASTTAAVAGTGKLRNDLVYLDMSDPNTPTYGIAAASGTIGTALTATTGLAGVAFSSLTKDQVPVAIIIAPASASAASDFKIVDVRPAF